MTQQLLSHFDRERIIWECTAAPSQKLLMLALNSFVDGEGKCFPGLDRLSKMMGASTATVKRAIRELEAEGVLSHQNRRFEGRQTSNLYTVDFQGIRSSFCTSEDSAAQNEPRTAAQNEPRTAAQNEPRSIQSLSVQSLSIQKKEKRDFFSKELKASNPIDLVAERYKARALAGRGSDFEKAWQAWQRGRASCKLAPDSGKQSAQSAWVNRFPTGKAPDRFFGEMEAYWEECQRKLEAKQFLPIPGFVKFLVDLSYLEAALGENHELVCHETQVLKDWGKRQDWENFPLLQDWTQKHAEMGVNAFVNLGGRYSPQHRFSDWLIAQEVAC